MKRLILLLMLFALCLPFAALAEEECAIQEYVSRETLDAKSKKSLKNQEKLEICIDD